MRAVHRFAVWGIAFASATSACAASAAQLTTLYNFTGGADGAYPTTGLLRGPDGVLYGTTEGGDADGFFGTVFRLTPPPPARPRSKWTKDNLHTFAGGRDGAYPWTRLIFDLNTGALMGTTPGDDTRRDFGTVFRLIPPARRNVLPWKEQIIHRFTGGSDSGYPYVALAQDASTGAVYGTAYGNSTNTDYGSIFGFTPDLAHKVWTRTLQYNFTYTPDGGGYPEGGLVQGRAGIFYGTTCCGGPAGEGTIYAVNSANSQVTFLHQSTGKPDPANFGYGQMIVDNQFKLYGTSIDGTVNCGTGIQCGTVFTFDPDSTKPPKVIHKFTGRVGGEPYTGLTWDLTRTVLYGTVSFGGRHKCSFGSNTFGCGFVFKLTPDGNKWAYSVVYEFTGGADGYKPHELVIDTEGTLYGEAEFGGVNGFGTIFKIENL